MENISNFLLTESYLCAIMTVSTQKNFISKSVAGIVTSGNGDNIGTWGTTINPTLLRFFM